MAFYTTIDSTSIDTALTTGGLDWEPRTVPLFTGTGDEVKSHVAILGQSDSQLDVIGSGHSVYGNHQMMEDMFRLADATGTRPCGVNVLNGGADLLVHMPLKSFEIAGDQTDMYVTARDNRVGKRAFELAALSYRLICENGMILTDKKGEIRNRHTSRFHDRLPGMFKAFQNALEHANGVEDFSRRLAGWRMSNGYKLIETAHDQVISPRPKTEDTKKIMRWERAKLAFLESVGEIYNSPTCQTAATKGTGFGFFNAITEWIDRPENGRVKDRTAFRFTGESTGTRKKRDLMDLFESSLALASL